ncbi:MAG: hypothetical protein EON51_15145 [Acinetobacter sp.]|nr:MAG: hypothetical protein EON51_15145 [Acinetobacter sp.]
MSLSTNSIIHYTDTFKKLLGILSEGFSIKYCAERLVVDGSKGSSAAHPMISFCDIPLSQSSEHFSSYGKYGIGLSKYWVDIPTHTTPPIPRHSTPVIPGQSTPVFV